MWTSSSQSRTIPQKHLWECLSFRGITEKGMREARRTLALLSWLILLPLWQKHNHSLLPIGHSSSFPRSTSTPNIQLSRWPQSLELLSSSHQSWKHFMITKRELLRRKSEESGCRMGKLLWGLWMGLQVHIDISSQMSLHPYGDLGWET